MNKQLTANKSRRITAYLRKCNAGYVISSYNPNRPYHPTIPLTTVQIVNGAVRYNHGYKNAVTASGIK